jgi:glycosyltransferase involved in cell wall biosynthesis
MRICLVAHGFPPEERTGVETYTASLAASFASAGHKVEVFAACTDPKLADMALRRAVVVVGDASYGVTRISTNSAPNGPEEMLDPPGIAKRFAAFLERERPEVVHFQHVIKLGLGLIEAANTAGIPTLYTHHDYYGCCHRFTFLRPDLSVCKRPNDTEACARCDVALGLLNDVEGLGDYQMGVAPSALSDDVRSRLAGLLDGDHVVEGGLAKGELEKAIKRRESLDKRRTKVFGEISERLAPSHFLADKLQATGMGKVAHLVYGINGDELLPLRESAPVTAPAPGKPLRILYIGSFVKQKGIEVLLDAFEALQAAPESLQRPRAELTVRGYASDEKWVAKLEQRASEVGAHFPGGYQRDELSGVLAQADVVVVPSTWFENYPIAIREAFAAGRPVLTSRLGALEESVQDGVDGLLFDAGDSQDLARALGRLLDEPTLLEKLVAGIGKVHTVEEQTQELLNLYQSKVKHLKVEDLSASPKHMQPFLQRCKQLEGTPSRELFQGVLGDLGRLAGKLGLDSEDLQASPILKGALSFGAEVQLLLRDFKRETEWLRESLDTDSTSGEALRARLTWLEETLGGRDETIQALEAQRHEQLHASRALTEKATWLEEGFAGKDKEVVWLRETVASLTEERDLLAAAQSDLRSQLISFAGTQSDLRSQLDSFAGTQTDLMSQRDSLLGGLTDLAGQRDSLEGGLVDIVNQRDSLADALAGALANSADQLKEMLLVEDDLAGRKREMQALFDEASSPLLKFIFSRTGFGKRVKRWGQGDLVQGEEESS